MLSSGAGAFITAGISGAFLTLSGVELCNVVGISVISVFGLDWDSSKLVSFISSRGALDIIMVSVIVFTAESEFSERLQRFKFH